MILFDEKAYAEKMHDTQSFIKSFGLTDLSIYARWLKYKKMQEIGKNYDTLTDDELKSIECSIEAELIDFSSKHYSEFNYTIHYHYIDSAIANTRDRKLLIPIDLPITKKEYETLAEIEDDNCRRILFAMLVESKYFRFNNASVVDVDVTEETMFFVHMKYNEILKVANTCFQNREDKRKALYYLCSNGYIDITEIKNLIYVKIVDIDKSEENVVDKIFDYDHIGLHYDRLFGIRKIGVCSYCGCLFKQGTKGNRQYCYRHRGYNKKGLRFGKCVDCGKEFSVSANDKNKIRCDKCQRTKHLNDMKDWQRRNKAKI